MGRSPRGRVLAFLLVLTVSGCRPDRTHDDAGPLTLSPSDVHLLGSSESIGEIEDLDVLSDGSVWVLNSVEPYFIGFDAHGDIIDQHGTSGGGPDEFPMPAGFLDGGLDGQVWVFDFVRHAFIRVSKPDGEWAQVTIPRDEIPPGTVRGGMSLMSSTVRTARLGDDVVFPWTTGTLESGVSAYHMALLRAELAALDPRTDSVRKVVALGDVLDDPSEGFVATDGGFPLWYRLWAACGDHLRVYDRVRNELRGFTVSGQEIAPIALPPVRLVEATPAQFTRAVFPLRQAEVTGGVGTRMSSEDSAGLAKQMAQGLKGDPRELAAYLPRYVDFRCSDDGTMWLQPIDLDAGGLQGGPTWLRVTPDGVVRDVHLPGRFDAFRFRGKRIWGVQRDALDVATVAWIELTGKG
ncbi:MAG TPA: hypothetical protein VJ997_02690 [Longimicrobiales bacterium]|nr:hypothetical protein [Longimicrobiales bacterium]